MDEKPRMTAEEAGARFDALVQEHRRKKPTRGPRRSRIPRAGGLWDTGIVFVIGIAVGVVFHAKPAGAVLLGLPLLLVGRALLARLRTGDTDED